jgi:hypothetical protein
MALSINFYSRLNPQGVRVDLDKAYHRQLGTQKTFNPREFSFFLERV